MSKLRHCGLLVHDLEMAIKLYTDVFGFKVIKKGVILGEYAEQLFNISNLHLTFIKMKSKGSNTYLELWKIKDFIPPAYKGFSHIALTVKDLDKIYEQLKERKLEFFSPPMKAKDSNVRLCFCRDYDSNIIELVEDKRLKP
jgi:catechol 2,3-dioxygenase-like lactoylglutathione lyase family enzyme